MSGRPPPLALYRALTGLAEPFAPALLRARARRGKEDEARLAERLGRPSRERPPGPLVWLHGASVGETLSILPLVERLRAERPDIGLLITSGTVTSAELLARRLPEGVIHQFAPIDAPAAADRFLAHWRPDLVVLAESELWPNLIAAARARGARLALVSARITESSARGWARAPESARTMLGAFDLILAQDEASAARLTALGGKVDGRLNLKLAGAAPPVDAQALAAARKAAADRPVLLAASTHPGEDEPALEAFSRLDSAALLVIVPRHPARAEAIARSAQLRGFEAARRSEGAAFGAAPVYVADTLGELGLWFSLAACAFVGGSLVTEPGGHNPLEAGRLGCPIVSGPYVANWAEVYADLAARHALAQAAGLDGLADAFAEAVLHPAAAQAKAARALAYAQAQSRTLDAAWGQILPLLPA